MKGITFGLLTAVSVGSLSAATHAAVIFRDDFESGTMSNWTQTGTTAGTSLVNVEEAGRNAGAPGTRSAKSDISNDRMHNNLGAEVSGASSASWWIYDDGTTSSSGTGSGRWWNEIRGYTGGSGLPDGGATPSGSWSQLIAMGKYNSTTLAGDTYTATKYQGRISFGPANFLWFNLSGGPNRSVGWHEFKVERLADNTTYNFYVDTVLARTFTAADNMQNVSWDTAVIGPALGSQVGNVWTDDFLVETAAVPEPMSLALLGLVGAGLLSRRRA